MCFGGQLMRGNRAQKVDASGYQAFDSPTYHKLALMGVEVDWQQRYLLQVSALLELIPYVVENDRDSYLELQCG